MSELDVLIVGAGPTGLTMAAELARRDVRCRIVERNAEPAAESRALVIQPRTMEVFDQMDGALAAGASDGAQPLRVLNVIAGGRRLIRMRIEGMDALGTPYPYPLIRGRATPSGS